MKSFIKTVNLPCGATVRFSKGWGGGLIVTAKSAPNGMLGASLDKLRDGSTEFTFCVVPESLPTLLKVIAVFQKYVEKEKAASKKATQKKVG